MGIKIAKLPLDGACLLEMFESADERGKFHKYFDAELLKELKFEAREVFASSNRKGVVRGLHLQKPKPQARIVLCPYGRVWDAMVDLRKESKTYLKWHAEELSDANRRGVYVPRGYAHGFLALTDGAYVLYLADAPYDEKSETGIIYNDPSLGIRWPIEGKKPIMSKRDLGFGKFDERKHAYE